MSKVKMIIVPSSDRIILPVSFVVIPQAQPQRTVAGAPIVEFPYVMEGFVSPH